MSGCRFIHGVSRRAHCSDGTLIRQAVFPSDIPCPWYWKLAGIFANVVHLVVCAVVPLDGHFVGAEFTIRHLSFPLAMFFCAGNHSGLFRTTGAVLKCRVMESVRIRTTKIDKLNGGVLMKQIRNVEFCQWASELTTRRWISPKLMLTQWKQVKHRRIGGKPENLLIGRWRYIMDEWWLLIIIIINMNIERGWDLNGMNYYY